MDGSLRKHSHGNSDPHKQRNPLQIRFPAVFNAQMGGSILDMSGSILDKGGSILDRCGSILDSSQEYCLSTPFAYTHRYQSLSKSFRNHLGAPSRPPLDPKSSDFAREGYKKSTLSLFSFLTANRTNF